MGKKHKKHKSDGHHSEERPLEKTPLKLVLKLGSEVMYDSDYAANSPASTTNKSSAHRSRKRKKKRRYDDEIYSDPALTPEVVDVPVAPVENDSQPAEVASSQESVVSPKVAEAEEDMEVQLILPVPTKPNPKPPKLPLTIQMRKALNNMLEHLLKQLERKDTHDVFAWPVNDMIAPGYSSVISQPMDFSTMRSKISTNQYFDVTDFKSDFDLMINNCCLYNNAKTVYHEIAKKVGVAGAKIMSAERLKNMRRSLNFLHDLTKQELSQLFGFFVAEEEPIEVAVNVESSTDVEPVKVEEMSTSPQQENRKELSEKETLKAHADAISFTDADNEDTVAIDAVEAMKKAKKRLADACPKNRMGFLRMDNEGRTTFNILNPDAGEVSECEVDLGGLTGSISSGFDVMPEAKEDKRNKVTPLEYLSYGPFGSYAPTYDSRMSNLTQEESDLLLSAYGGDTGFLFARSVEEFVSDSNKGLIKMVDDILDTVTHGAHSNAIEEIQQKRSKAKAKKTKRKSDVKVDLDELKSLQDLGIDISFLKEVEAVQQSTKSKPKDEEITKNIDIDKTLELNSELLKQLEKEQYNRLGSKQPTDEPNLEPPGAQEQAIADELQQTLADLTAGVTPADVCHQSAVRRAIGISTSL